MLSLDDLVELLLVSRVEMVLRDLRTRRVDLGDGQRFFAGAPREERGETDAFGRNMT